MLALTVGKLTRLIVMPTVCVVLARAVSVVWRERSPVEESKVCQGSAVAPFVNSYRRGPQKVVPSDGSLARLTESVLVRLVSKGEPAPIRRSKV